MSDAAFTWERRAVFDASWLMLGGTHQVEEPGSFFTVSILGGSYVICRDLEGQLRAFHNVSVSNF